MPCFQKCFLFFKLISNLQFSPLDCLLCVSLPGGLSSEYVWDFGLWHVLVQTVLIRNDNRWCESSCWKSGFKRVFLLRKIWSSDAMRCVASVESDWIRLHWVMSIAYNTVSTVQTGLSFHCLPLKYHPKLEVPQWNAFKVAIWMENGTFSCIFFALYWLIGFSNWSCFFLFAFFLFLFFSFPFFFLT